MPSAPPAALDPSRALIALGDLVGACDRRALPDVLAAWRRYLEAMNRRDLIDAAPLFEAVAIAPSAEAYEHLARLATATARNVHAHDADRHWRIAAATFAQAAVNAAARCGGQVASQLREWQRVDWTDEDGDALRAIGEDLLAAGAAQAAHYARFVTGQSAWRVSSDADRREADARIAVDHVIDQVLRDLEIVRSQHVNLPGTFEGEALVCDTCHEVDGHAPDCPTRRLTAAHLLRVYRAALDGRA
jgi:hypothetical protein